MRPFSLISRGEKKSDNQCSSFQVKKKRGAALLEPQTEPFQGVFRATQIPEGNPSSLTRRKELLPCLLTRDHPKPAQCRFPVLPVCVPVLAPGAGPIPTVAMPGLWVCLEDLAALSSGPLCSAPRLEEPAPVPTGQCLDMRLETGDTHGDTAPAPQYNRTWIFGVGISKADRDGFRVLFV